MLSSKSSKYKKSLHLKYYFKVRVHSLDTPSPLVKPITQLSFEDKRIIALGFISCCFEGSMYIFVFFWSAAMKSAHVLSMYNTDNSDESHIPFGIIFATFMAAMMLGSLAFSFNSNPSTIFSSKSYFLTSSSLLTIAIAGASSSLLLTVLFKKEAITFWCFCIFEACIGIYYPSIGAQKACIVDDGVRAKIYGILRIPLNIFVVIALTTTVEGDEHRDHIFLFCGGLLLLASVAAGYCLKGEPTETEFSDVESSNS